MSHLLQLIKQNSEYFKQCQRGLMSKVTNNRFRYLVNKQVMETKHERYKTIFSNCRSSMRKSWDKITHLFGKQITHRKFKEVLINDENITDES